MWRWLPSSFLVPVLFWGCSVESNARLPRADGSMDAVADSFVPPDGPCVAAAEECNGRDDDCDDLTDEGFDLDRDRNHCGSCDNACPPDPANGGFVCEGGECISGCDFRFGDCDEMIDNGCETPLLTSANCGACNAACEGDTPFCSGDGSMPTCVPTCDAPWTLCPAGGCVDTRTDVTNCGACDARCPDRPNATSECVGGSCRFRCDDGFGDCDGSAINGCEAPLDEPDRCGSCTNRCMRPGAIASCDSGACEYTCMTDLADCDGNPMNGCERRIDTISDCGACGASCDLPDASELCSSGTCVIDACTRGRADCDGNPVNGCEADLSSAASCGACGVTCAAGEDCVDDVCCPSGWTCQVGCGMPTPCTCSGGTDCSYRCDGGCDVRCQNNGTECRAAAATGEDAVLHCQSGATCTFDARGASNVQLTCQNNNTSCTLDCRGTDSCEVECLSNADCELLCDPGDPDCGFTTCSSVEDCGGGRFRCNFSC